MRNCSAFVLLGFLLVFAASTARGQSPVLASCAWVRAENDGAGSGFVVDTKKKLLITCRHLIDDRKKVDVFFPWYRQGELAANRRDYLGNRLLLRELGLLVTGSVLKTSDELDLALVQLESLPPGIRAVSFAPSPATTGENLRVIGNRLDLDTVWNLTTGTVRATGPLADGYFWRGKKLAENAETVIGQLPTEEGDSGGPVFNDRGELVGMASALRRDCPLAAAAISASEIRKFAGLGDPPAKRDQSRSPEVVEALTRATVWVRPTSTNVHMAGTIVDRNLILTCGRGLSRGDRAGVAFPIRQDNRWVGERAPYKDPISLALRGYWRSALVVAIDVDRDLALLRLESTPELMRRVPLAEKSPDPGDQIHGMSHPGGLEFAWVYASGVVRQRGSLAISPGDNARRVSTLVCQLPAQAGSPGGPILNDRGELVGILAAKESTQLVGYAASVDEIAVFLDIARRDRPCRTLDGLLARIDDLPGSIARDLARGLARRGEKDRLAGHLEDAKKYCSLALSFDPACPLARICRARMLEPENALAELDIAAEKGPFDRPLLLLRAHLAAQVKDWRKARGDLERLVDANPLDAEARQMLVGVLLELNEDAKALAAVGDTLRADPARMPTLSIDLLSQAETLAKKFPDAPGIPAGWLQKTLMAAEKATTQETMKAQLGELLRRGAATRDDAERLRLFRDGLMKMANK